MGEYFHDGDPEAMLRRVRQSRKPCLIFKVYGASRRCASEAQMAAALRQAAEAAKPSDCFVIGMFPKQNEQVRQNCRLVIQSLRESRSSSRA
jgi:hypothetical protein